MRQFYQALAAMALLHEDERHAVLELEGFQLVACDGHDPEGNVLQVRGHAA